MCGQPLPDQPQQPPIRDPMLDELLQPPVVDGVENPRMSASSTQFTFLQ
jgi:hypothetical protein